MFKFSWIRAAYIDSKVEQLHARADSIFAQFKRGCGTHYMDEAILIDRQALDLCPPFHPKRPASLIQLQRHLRDRYNHLRTITDIEEAIVLGRQVLDLHPQGHPDRWMSLNTLAVCLSTRYKQLGAMTDLEEVIVLGREALNLRPRGHPSRSMSLTTLAADLSSRYDQLGAMMDLNEAIVLGRETIDLCPRGHPARSMPLSNLACFLATRYKQLGALTDLDGAIAFGREALDLCPPGNPDRPTSLNSIALCLSTRYKQFGTMADLDEAIALKREAVDLCARGHHLRSLSLNNLAADLSTRYKLLGAMSDLNDAIVLGREALDLCPQGHPDRSMSLNNVALYLWTRYKRLETMADLDSAIVLGREALHLRARGHPLRSTSLNNAVYYLFARYKQVGVMTDLSEAIVLGREAVDLCPQGHSDRSMCLNGIALCLSARYSKLGEMADLDEAIALGRDALQLRPSGHPDRSQSLENLTGYLHIRFSQSGQLKDKDDLFSLYAELTQVPQMVSSTDLSATKAWINAAEGLHHSTTLLAYETSLRLLIQHLATLPSLPQHLPILKKLTSSLAVDAFSACLRDHDPVKAVELLEQGRGVFWNQITRLRSPLDDVIISSPVGKTLADEFTKLTSLICNVINSPCADQHDRLCRLNLELQGVVTHIRELPGLARFLLPSLFSDLQRAASGGPVIIVNASKYSCDALIVFVDREPVHIPLRITKEHVNDLSSELQALTSREKEVDVTRDLGRIMRELWEEVVFPVVDFLRTTLPIGSRIWWCPTAEFTLLPLHATGPYRSNQPNLSHLYISSYTPTLTALIRAGRSHRSDSATRKHFIAIGEAKADGETELVSVGTELAIVGQRIEGRAIFTHIEGAESCISRVSKELRKNEWVHLACHGVPNRQQPFDSAFGLYDGHFTIQDIMRCELENSEFAYLSACHTTVGDEESPDEVIHLASAMQFAGFRSVIGTMWAVDDRHTNKITSVFYDNMVDEAGCLDHTRAAFALNRTMNMIDIVPFDQRILYIHIGA